MRPFNSARRRARRHSRPILTNRSDVSDILDRAAPHPHIFANGRNVATRPVHVENDA